MRPERQGSRSRDECAAGQNVPAAPACGAEEGKYGDINCRSQSDTKQGLRKENISRSFATKASGKTPPTRLVGNYAMRARKTCCKRKRHARREEKIKAAFSQDAGAHVGWSEGGWHVHNSSSTGAVGLKHRGKLRWPKPIRKGILRSVIDVVGA